MARTKGAVGFSDSERQLIKIWLVAGRPCSEMAALLGRERTSVWRQIQKITAADDGQQVLPLEGQGAE